MAPLSRFLPNTSFTELARPALISAETHYGEQAHLIQAHAATLALTSDAQLRMVATADNHSSLACALVGARRVLGQVPFRSQVVVALALLDGCIAELPTGAGKTLAIALAATVLATSSRRADTCPNADSAASNKHQRRPRAERKEDVATQSTCHVFTFNDYLAQRDAEQMTPLFQYFDLSVGTVTKASSWAQRAAAYQADITYSTAQEAGFDFLRTQLCSNIEAQFSISDHAVIVDEADSILIDEARVPLIIAASDEPDKPLLHNSAAASDDAMRATWPTLTEARACALVEALPMTAWNIDQHGRNAVFTDIGFDLLEAQLGSGSLHTERNMHLLTALNQALHARLLLQRNVDYVVRDGNIALVDEFTGRIAANRRWPDGLHAAVEAKAGLPPGPAGQVVATIALQHFLTRYAHIAGTTATAKENADEFYQRFSTPVALVTPESVSARSDLPDAIFKTQADKIFALAQHIEAQHALGRPILVGTGNVQESRAIAEHITHQLQLSCVLLNAENDADEAAVIAQAGRFGAITISTNMAGRGIDIKLGAGDAEEYAQVVLAGGLCVLGTQRFESARIDRQLRGRAGRQGDPGSSQLFISLEDPLLVRYQIDEYLPPRLRPNRESNLSNAIHRTAVDRLQRVVDAQNADIRTKLWRYSALQEAQRQAIAQWRQQVLHDASDIVIGEAIATATQQCLLAMIDRHWTAHLRVLADLAESAHLTIRTTDIGGLDPYLQFAQRAHRAFLPLRAQVEERTKAALAAGVAPRTSPDGQPRGTWSYVVDDNFFGEYQSFMLNQAHNGTASITVMLYWPIVLAWGIWRKLRKRFMANAE